MRLPHILREPLLHFIVIGAALFAFAQWGNTLSSTSASKIVLTAGQIDHLVAGFQKSWKRPPTEIELKGIIDDWVREELAVQAAMKGGLDRGDVVIRRRLRQKFEFFVEELGEPTAATEEALKSWFAANAPRYRTDPRFAFQHVYFSKQRRGEAAAGDAAALLQRLAIPDTDEPTVDLGDSSLLPRDVGPATPREIEEMFGIGFVDALRGATPGRWIGPIASAYGAHLVLLREHHDGVVPEFSDVRSAVERDYSIARRQQQLDRAYDALIKKYNVVIEAPGKVAPGKAETGQ